MELLLGLFVKTIDQGEEGIAGNDVVPSLNATLGVDGATYIGELAQQVEGIEFQDEVALEKSF